MNSSLELALRMATGFHSLLGLTDALTVQKSEGFLTAEGSLTMILFERLKYI